MATIKTVVTIGASVSRYTFSRNTDGPTWVSGYLRAALAALGKEVDQKDYAVSGATLADVLVQANQVILDYSAQDSSEIAVVIHAGGNNNSANGGDGTWPWSQALQDEFTDGLTAIYTVLNVAGFNILPTPLTHRSGVNDSTQANINIIYPLIQTLAPHAWDVAPRYNWYTASYNYEQQTGNYFASGVHQTWEASRDALSVETARALADVFDVRDKSPNTRYLVSHRLDTNLTGLPNGTALLVGTGSSDGELTESLTGVAAAGSSVVFTGYTSESNTNGVSLPVSDSVDVLWHESISGSMWAGTGVACNITVTLPDHANKTATVTVTGVRASAGSRTTVFEGDSASTATVDATDTAPQVGTFEVTLDGSGVGSITATPLDSGHRSYFSSMEFSFAPLSTASTVAGGGLGLGLGLGLTNVSG